MSLLTKSVLTFLLVISTQPIVAGDIAAGKDKSMMCMGCHGETGISVSPEIPNLAGQKELYLVNQLKDFRAQIRKNPVMFSMAGGLTDQEIENLAAYYASLK